MAAQLLFVEICSSNSVLESQAGITPDWIEFHYSGSDSMLLSNYYLSNDGSDPYKSQLPDFHIQANEYLVLFGEDDDAEGDFNFSLSNSGESLFLFNQEGLLLQSVTIPSMQANHSFGIQDGGWHFFNEQSPGSANNAEAFSGYTEPPFIQVASGFTDQAFELDILHLSGNIHYTLDGRDPGTNDSLYTGTLEIQETTTLKAMAVEPGKLPSEWIARCWLFNEHHELPIVALIVDPDSLFHPDLGLYMTGPNASAEWPYFGANYWSERSIDTDMLYFVDETLEIEQQIELKIHGGKSSRNMPQRPFRLTARSRLGSDHIDYPFFATKPESFHHKRIILRNSGSDFLKSNYRDGFWHLVAAGQGLDIDYYGFTPVVLFINGEYWGIMNIRERGDKHYLAANHNVDPDSVIIGEKENVPFVRDSIYFDQFTEELFSLNPESEEFIDFVYSQLDYPSYMDYFGLEVFAGNPDWPANNIKFWKASPGQGKWRYILFDLDTTMELFEFIPFDVDLIDWIYGEKSWSLNSRIFIHIMESPELRRLFINRLADMMNYHFLIDELSRIQMELNTPIEPEIEAHFIRWGAAASTWEEQVHDLIPSFFQVRHQFVRNQLLEHYNLDHEVKLEFKTQPHGAGEILVNTIQPELPFKGVYFHGNPIDVEVIPSPGFEFLHCLHSSESIEDGDSPRVQLDLSESGVLTAVFRTHSDPGIQLLGNPVSEHLVLNLNDAMEAESAWEILDLAGKQVSVGKRELFQGQNVLSIRLPEMPQGIYVFRLVTSQQSWQTRFMIE